MALFVPTIVNSTAAGESPEAIVKLEPDGDTGLPFWSLTLRCEVRACKVMAVPNGIVTARSRLFALVVCTEAL